MNVMEALEGGAMNFLKRLPRLDDEAVNFLVSFQHRRFETSQHFEGGAVTALEILETGSI